MAAATNRLVPGQTDPAYQLACDVTLAAENRGFELALVAERHLGPDLEAWILAAALAARTQRIQIMPAANPDYWHPVLLAKMAATLDRVAPGRSAINFITGWNDDEQRTFSSVRHLDDEAKYRRAEAFVATMRQVWSGTAVTVDDEFPLDGVKFALMPGGDTPPIYAVSRSSRGLRMVARSADYWFVDYGATPEESFDEVLQRIRTSMERMAHLASNEGRTVGACMNAFICVGDSRVDAERRAAHLREKAFAADAQLAPIRTSGLNVGLVGTAEEIGEKAAALADLGVDLLLCKFEPTVDELGVVADAVRAQALVTT